MGSRNNKPGRIVKGTTLQPNLKGASGVWTLDEAMQAHRANAWPQPNLFQPISNSLRLKKNSGTLPFITKTPGRPGNLLKWTVSAWVKLGAIGTASRMELFSAGDTASATTPANMSLMINWQGYSQDWHIAFLTGGGSYQIQTNMVLRDPSAWYHVVVVYDAAQSTNTNRVQIYINGVLASWSSTAPTGGAAAYTPQNLPLNWNNAGQIQRIGSGYDGGETYFLDGNIAEFYNIDGHALPPTLFGKFDTNNTWVPVAYTGSYGTNGFYLPFTNATTSQTLGYDASLTGTTTYDADQDPYRGSVALHLTGNGPAGGQNNTFADSSSNNLTVTRGGTVTQGSVSPFPFNTNTPYNPAIHGASAFWTTSTADYVSIADNSVLQFDGAFTIEFWSRQTAYGGTANYRYFQKGSNSLTGYCLLDSGGTIYFGRTDEALASFSQDMRDNAWHHFAVTRDTDNKFRIFLDGVLKSTSASAYSDNLNVSAPLYIGAYPGTAGSENRYTGYISNFRVIKGVAVYTAAFTPTNKPFGTLTNNLLPFSEDISNGVWTAQSQNISFTPNAAIAPDGTPSATLLVPSTSSAGQNIAGLHDSAAGVNTFSIYAKSAGYRYMQCFHSRSAGGDLGYVTFDLTTGVVTNSSVWSGSIVNVGNGWYRLISTTSSLTGASANSNVRWSITDGSASRAPAFTGNGTSGIYVWGAQAELASSVGNYTPTPANFKTAPSLLLNFANSAVTDSAGANNLLTGNNATITSASKYGSGALTFNGSTDKIQMASGSQFNFGTGDFTVEAWINPTTVNVWQVIFKTSSDTSWTGGVTLALNNGVGSGVRFRVGTAFVDSATSITPNTWTHVAITRNNASCRIFLNGKLDASLSNIETADAQTTPTVGNETSGSSYPYIGSIDDLRVTRGLARYKSDFAPPARALPETGGKSFITTNVTAGVVQRFTTTGTTAWTAPSDVTQVEVLVVAGGGGGGGEQETPAGGGGGAGGLIYNNSYPVTPGQTYTVTVGAGGAGGVGRAVGSTGANSVFGNLVAIGGGGGGFYSGLATAGGSGGGAGWRGAVTSGASGTAGQGFAGGTVTEIGALQGAAGGGGAGGVGANASGRNAGAGGAGLQFGISGTAQFYAGGGGGGGGFGDATPGTGAAGGSSVGGAGSNAVDGGAAGANGTANTGSGGGGAGADNAPSYTSKNGGAGGSGIVLIRYTTTAVANTSDATTDNLVDSPTQYGHDSGLGGEVVGNYATFNPIYAQSATVTLSNGNLTASNPSTWVRALGTIAVNTGKWYFESTPSAGNWHMTGVEQPIYGTTHIGGSATKGIALVYDPSNTRGDISYNGGNSVYTGGSVTFNAGDIIGVALDLDNNNVKLYKNNVLQYNLSNLLQAGAYYTFGVSLYSGGTISGNFGQRAWAYAPPAGFSALTTKNFARPAIAQPAQHFGYLQYTGNGAGSRSFTGLNFRPDLVIIKDRTNSSTNTNWIWCDAVRGASNTLFSNNAFAAYTDRGVSTFDTAGFTLDAGTNGDLVTSTDLFTAWCWKAGNGTVSNTNGTITSTVSANTTAGFSIVTYTGGATGATVGHGLGVTPAFVITKCRNATQYWIVHHQDIAITSNMYLQTSDTPQPDNQYTAKSSTTLTLGANNSSVNTTGNTYVSYCWAEIPGYSKFGSYTGNGSAEGPFVYTGFKPAFVIVKNTTASGAWIVKNNGSNLYNPMNTHMNLSSTHGDYPDILNFDFTLNGFKVRNTNSGSNTSTNVYVYMAFAETPFGNVNGTAR